MGLELQFEYATAPRVSSGELHEVITRPHDHRTAQHSAPPRNVIDYEISKSANVMELPGYVKELSDFGPQIQISHRLRAHQCNESWELRKDRNN